MSDDTTAKCSECDKGADHEPPHVILGPGTRFVTDLRGPDTSPPTRTVEDIIQGAINEWATIAGGPHADAGEQVTLAHYIASRLAEA